MDDRDLERRLRRFRVADPPLSLRSRVLARARERLPQREPVLGWSLALAAVLALAVWAHVATERVTADIALVGPDPQAQVIADLAIRLGDTHVARQMAVRIVASHEANREARPGDAGGER